MEGYVISIMIIVVVCGAVALYDNMKVTTEDRIRTEYEKRYGINMPVNTRLLVFDALYELKCNPKSTEDGRILCKYQDWYFIIDASETCKYIDIFFYSWYQVPLDDLLSLSALQRAINLANKQASDCNFLYVVNTEHQVAIAHAHARLIFIREHQERVSYLRFVFEDILSGASAVVSEVEKRMGE